MEDVWDACTSAERIPRWFLPVSGDLRLGGRYQLEGNAGGDDRALRPAAALLRHLGVRRRGSWIEVRLPRRGGRPDAARARAHRRASSDERWAEFGPAAVGIGWDMALLGLALHLSGGQVAGPEEGALWAASDEGRDFMTLSGERWCDAQIEAGEDPAAARAAADRTITAYTAAPVHDDGDGD